MVKYESDFDDDFQNVSTKISVMSKRASGKVADNWSEWGRINDEVPQGMPWTPAPSPNVSEGGSGHGGLTGEHTTDANFAKVQNSAQSSNSSRSSGSRIENISRAGEDAWEVVMPDSVEPRSFMLGVKYGQQLDNDSRYLIDQPVDISPAPFNSLYLVKTRNTGSNSIEVHRAGPATNYGRCNLNTGTAADLTDSDNGTWLVEKDNVYFIKVRNAGSDIIEIHSLSSKSSYSRFNIHSRSGFDIADDSNGVWKIDNDDLYYIKTKNTGSGFIGVHRADHQRNFEVTMHAVTQFRLSDEANGDFTIRRGDLYFVKSRNTQSGKTEVYCAPGEQNFQSFSYPRVTWFEVDRDGNASWDIGTNGDLYLILKRNTESGQVEVHIVEASSGYQEVRHFATAFSEADVPNGFFCV